MRTHSFTYQELENTLANNFNTKQMRSVGKETGLVQYTMPYLYEIQPKHVKHSKTSASEQHQIDSTLITILGVMITEKLLFKSTQAVKKLAIN